MLNLEPDDVRASRQLLAARSAPGCVRNIKWSWPALAARALKRSVRLVLTRQQMYGLGYRPAMIQRIELGANAGGTLDTITHEAITVTSQYEDFHRQETGWSGLLYKAPTLEHAQARAARSATSCDMRAPSAAAASMRLNARWTSSRSP